MFLDSRKKAQVSMTLNSLNDISLWGVYEAVCLRAGQAGVDILESEIVGLVPMESVVRALGDGLKLTRFSSRRILEEHFD